MGTVVPMIRMIASRSGPSVDTTDARRRMQRDEALASLKSMLDGSCRTDPRLEMVVRLAHDGYVVVAVIDGRLEQRLCEPYPEDRLEHFNMVVRGCSVRWRAALARRMGMRAI